MKQELTVSLKIYFVEQSRKRMKYLGLFLLIVLLGCTERTPNSDNYTYQQTILILQHERDSLIVLKDSLSKKKKKCDEWVQMLEKKNNIISLVQNPF